MRQQTKQALYIGALLTFSVATAFAGPPPKEFQDKFFEGEKQYRLGNVDEAQKLFEEAKQIFPEPAGTYRYLSAIYFEQKKFDLCIKEAFIAVSKNPDSKKSDQVRQLHNDCRKALGRAQFKGEYGANGALAVETSEFQVQIKINGLAAGGTPMKPRTAPVGNITVTATKRGFKTGTFTVEIIQGLVSDLEFELEPIKKAVVDDVDPNGATTAVATPDAIKVGWIQLEISGTGDASVTVDGSTAVPDERGRVELAPGPHRVEVSAPGYVTWSREVKVSRGLSRAIRVDLQSADAKASLRRNGYLALGASGALAVGGAVLGIMGTHALDEAEDIRWTESLRPSGPNTGDLVPVRTRQELDDARDRGERLQVISAVTLGLAGAALATSIYFFVSERTDEDGTKPASLVIAPLSSQGEVTGAAVSYSTEFGW